MSKIPSADLNILINYFITQIIVNNDKCNGDDGTGSNDVIVYHC